MFSFAGPMVLFSFGIMSSGIGSMLGGVSFWASFSTAAALAIGIMLLLYFLSVALISPASLNRALPVRIYLTVLWFLTACLTLFWIRKSGETQIIAAWAICSLTALIAALVVAISNEDELSVRVLRTVPSHP